MTHSAVLCLGSNMRPRRERILEALGRLRLCASVVNFSEILESDDITRRAGAYMNMAVEVVTSLEMNEFLVSLSQIERAGGRQPGSPLVSIDVDLVVWDGSVVSPEDFQRPYFRQLMCLSRP